MVNTTADSGKSGPFLVGGSFEEKRLIVNEDEPRMDTNADGPLPSTSGAKPLRQGGALGVAMS